MDALDVVTAVALVVTAVLGLGALGAQAWRTLRAITRFIDVMLGNSDHPGLIERMSAVERSVVDLHSKVDQIADKM